MYKCTHTQSKKFAAGESTEIIPLDAILINKCSGNSLPILNQISIFKTFVHTGHMMFLNSKNVLTYCLTDNLIEATFIFRK